MSHPLAVVLRRPYVPWLVSSSLVGRLPTGMTTLALVLLVRGRGADYALAGALAAAYGVGNAAGAPLLSRTVDRTRQPPVLAGAALVATVAFVAIGLAGPGRPLLAGVAAVVAGVATPPLEPCMRALWPGLLDGAAPVQTAYAFDAAAQELIFTAGPLIVLGGVALAGPEGGLWAAALVGLAGAGAFAAAPPARRWRAAAVAARHWAGPLRSRELSWLLVALGCAGATIGVGTVAFPALAESLGNRSLGGWLLAANALGAFLGGVGYGMVPAATAPRRRLLPLTALFAVGYLPPAVPVPLPLAVALALISGIMLPPVLACAFLAIDELAPAGTVVEAFAWVGTAFQIGIAVGAALAGRAIQAYGANPAFLAAVGLAVLAVLIVAVRRRRAADGPRRA